MSRSIYSLWLLALTIVLWVPVLIVTDPHAGDYQSYVDYARVLSTGTVSVPHIAYPFFIYLFSLVVGWDQSSFVTVFFFALVTPFVISWVIENRMGVWKSRREAYERIALIVGLTVAGPINMLTAPSGHLFRGYFSESSYASPSYIALRPMALIVFALCVAWIGNKRSMWVQTTIAILLAIVITLTKPNYTICFVPAAAAILVLPKLRIRFELRPSVAIPLIIAGVLTVLWQKFAMKTMTYSLVGLQDAPVVLIAPLVGMQSHWLFPKLLLSLAFPASILWIFRQALLSHTELLFAWLALVIGIGYAYLLVQPGILMFDGHFISCAQITLFIVFVVSIIELLRLREREGKWRRTPVTLFALHVAGGSLWYASRFYPFAGW